MMKHGILILLALLFAGCAPAAPAPTPTAAPSAPDYLDDLYGAVFTPPRTLSDFVIDSSTGEPFRFSDHQGQVLLLYFGYRACPDFCPTTFSEMRRVYAALGEPAEKLKILFVTVDPERDDLENLRLYANAFNEDFIALRDDGATLQQMMSEFGVVAEKRQVGESALSYLVDHTASVFLVGPDGRLQAQYLYGTNYRDIVHDVERILQTT
jgi:protein SCO1/2